MFRTLAIGIFSLLFPVLLSCEKLPDVVVPETPQQEQKENVEGNKEEEKKIEPTITPSTAPSTGEIKIIDLNSNTRPYAIMINCKSEALPQAGLQDAYLVYEEMVEGGITRMMALFKDKNLTKVGSIRSARVQYLPYVFENDAIYVHAGGSVEADNRMANEKINHIDADGQYGQRDMELAKKRAWEHTLFTRNEEIPEEIIQLAKQRLEAKQEKNYTLADELRNQIQSK